MGVSAFDKLRKFILSVDRSADMGEIRTVLDRNECTLPSVDSSFSIDSVFESVTIDNLTHLHLIHTRVSHFVLTRIASAQNLQSLTLPRELMDPDSASALFASDRIIDGSHTLLPHLEAFRFLLKWDNRTLYQSVVHFSQKRDKLRRLDLGGCPWDIVRDILPDLRNLRVLGVHIGHSSQEVMKSLVELIPRQMVAISIFADDSDKPLDQYAHYFSHFNTLSFLRLQTKPSGMLHEHVFRGHTDESFCSIAATIPSLDFLVWNYMPLIVVRPVEGRIASVQLEYLPNSRCDDYGGAVDFGNDDATWLLQKDVPLRS